MKDEAPTVVVREAGAPFPLFRTNAPSSVFGMAANGKRRVTHVAPPDPSRLTVISIPKPKHCGAPPSKWEAVYNSMPEGKAIELTKEQALSFADWAKRKRHAIKRQRIGFDGVMYAVWRPKEEA